MHLIHAVCSPLSLYIVLKFTFYSWQVPRSSVGRALYRESGPSQDGDPVPGNLLFLLDFVLYMFFFLYGSFLTEFVRKSKINIKYLRIPVFLLHDISVGSLPLTGKFTLFLHS